MNGTGLLVEFGKNIYVGEFQNKCKTGFGFEIDAIYGNYYIGQFDSGLKHGKGEFVYMDKRMNYKGDIYKNK